MVTFKIINPRTGHELFNIIVEDDEKKISTAKKKKLKKVM